MYMHITNVFDYQRQIEEYFESKGCTEHLESFWEYDGDVEIYFDLKDDKIVGVMIVSITLFAHTSQIYADIVYLDSNNADFIQHVESEVIELRDPKYFRYLQSSIDETHLKDYKEADKAYVKIFQG